MLTSIVNDDNCSLVFVMLIGHTQWFIVIYHVPFRNWLLSYWIWRSCLLLLSISYGLLLFASCYILQFTFPELKLYIVCFYLPANKFHYHLTMILLSHFIFRWSSCCFGFGWKCYSNFSGWWRWFCNVGGKPLHWTGCWWQRKAW